MVKEILEKIPGINLFMLLGEWSNGDNYAVEDDTKVVLPPELAESDQKTDKAYDDFSAQSKGKSGKGKSQYRVDEKQLNTKKQGKVLQDEKQVEHEKDGR